MFIEDSPEKKLFIGHSYIAYVYIAFPLPHGLPMQGFGTKQGVVERVQNVFGLIILFKNSLLIHEVIRIRKDVYVPYSYGLWSLFTTML